MRNSIRNDVSDKKILWNHGEFHADFDKIRVSLRRNGDFEAFLKLRNYFWRRTCVRLLHSSQELLQAVGVIYTDKINEYNSYTYQH